MSKSPTKSSAPSFDAFWGDSSYSRFNIKEFAAAQELYSAKEKVDAILEYPPEPLKLPLSNTKANTLARRRKSEREFSKEPLSKKEFGQLLSSFYAHNGLEHRAFPSAGGAYALEIFCAAINVSGFSGKLYYYNPDVNGISEIGKVPEWDKLSENVNIQTTGTPQCLIIFVIFPDRLTSKYLDRGGRFGLIEVGAAVQQLSLQIAGSRKLKGCAVGGMLDDYWLNILGLKKTEAKIALGYVCGK